MHPSAAALENIEASVRLGLGGRCAMSGSGGIGTGGRGGADFTCCRWIPMANLAEKKTFSNWSAFSKSQIACFVLICLKNWVFGIGPASFRKGKVVPRTATTRLLNNTITQKCWYFLPIQTGSHPPHTSGCGGVFFGTQICRNERFRFSSLQKRQGLFLKMRASRKQFVFSKVKNWGSHPGRRPQVRRQCRPRPTAAHIPHNSYSAHKHRRSSLGSNGRFGSTFWKYIHRLSVNFVDLPFEVEWPVYNSVRVFGKN